MRAILCVSDCQSELEFLAVLTHVHGENRIDAEILADNNNVLSAPVWKNDWKGLHFDVRKLRQAGDEALTELIAEEIDTGISKSL